MLINQNQKYHAGIMKGISVFVSGLFTTVLNLSEFKSKNLISTRKNWRVSDTLPVATFVSVQQLQTRNIQSRNKSGRPGMLTIDFFRMPIDQILNSKPNNHYHMKSLFTRALTTLPLSASTQRCNSQCRHHICPKAGIPI